METENTDRTDCLEPGDEPRLFHRAYKFRIYPNAEQRVLLAKHFGCCRFVYNHFLDVRGKEHISLFDTHHMVEEMRMTEQYSWLKEVYSHALRAALRNLDTAYQKFFKAKMEGKAVPIIRNGKLTGRLMYEPRFKSKRENSQSVTFPDNVKGGTWNRTKGARPFNNNGEPTDYTSAGSDASIGSAARFFYCPKASKKEKGKNCERILIWEKDQELIRLLEKSNQLLKDISESMMQNLADIECNTILFGKDTTEQSQKECKSIISMATKLTIELKTLSSFQHLNTNDYILDAIRTNEDSGINVVQLAEKLNQLRGVSIKDETQSVLSAVNALLGVLSEIRNCAKQGNQHPTVKPIELMKYLVWGVDRQGSQPLRLDEGSLGLKRSQSTSRLLKIVLKRPNPKLQKLYNMTRRIY